jgi:hypothetical protein
MLLFPAALWAQVTTSNINGVVKDATGKALEGATVTAMHQVVVDELVYNVCGLVYVVSVNQPKGNKAQQERQNHYHWNGPFAVKFHQTLNTEPTSIYSVTQRPSLKKSARLDFAMILVACVCVCVVVGGIPERRHGLRRVYVFSQDARVDCVGWERPERHSEHKGLFVVKVDIERRPEVIEKDGVEANKYVVSLRILEVFASDLPVCKHAQVLLPHL